VLVDDVDESIRAAAFNYVRRLQDLGGDRVLFRDLDTFEFGGERVPLIQRPRGIRVIPGMEAALTILTTFRADPTDRPYEDAEGPDGYLRYKWMGTDSEARDNRALRAAMIHDRPLIWFFGVASGEYAAVLPVYVVGEESEQQQFVVAIDESMREQWTEAFDHPVDLALRREYATAQVRRRVHQRVFRGRVLSAYGSQCALCRLRHRPLLDAAHIREDRNGGEPIVPNGVAMCAIHHRAFDNTLLGIRPDYTVEIRSDVLAEEDGPTLKHALQGLHLSTITLPRNRPSWPRPDLLEERFELFRAAG
jgi:putative restriction endonuclease